MATFSILNHFVFPTEELVDGGLTGGGSIGTETKLSSLWGRDLRKAVVDGFTLPSSGALTQSIPGGTAIINGYVITKATAGATISVTFDANKSGDTPNAVWLELTKISGLVTGAQIVVDSATKLPPSEDSVKIGAVKTGASTVSAPDSNTPIDQGPEGRIAFGQVILGGSNIRMVHGGSSDWYPDNTQYPTSRIHFTTAWKRTPLTIATNITDQAAMTISWVDSDTVDLSAGSAGDGDIVAFMCIL